MKIFSSSWISGFKRWFQKDVQPTSVGALGEKIASQFLLSNGYRILGTQVRVGKNEVDIIALLDRTIVFVEVKTWSQSSTISGPSEAVDHEKQVRLTQAALRYLKDKKLLNKPARFDVIEVRLDEQSLEKRIRHFVSAFEATGSFQMFA